MRSAPDPSDPLRCHRVFVARRLLRALLSAARRLLKRARLSAGPPRFGPVFLVTLKALAVSRIAAAVLLCLDDPDQEALLASAISLRRSA